MWPIVLIAVLVQAPENPQADVSRLPDSYEIDRSAGFAGEMPNRIRHRKLGIFLIRVPGGDFRIGSDDEADSRIIQVRVGEFYISERPASRAQVSAYVGHRLDEWAELCTQVAQGKLAEAERDRFVALTSACFSDFRFGAPEMELAEMLKLVESVARGQYEDALATRRKEIVPLPADGEVRYDGATWDASAGFARWSDAKLPTEAQWEIAIRAALEKKINLLDLPDDLWYEWCADFYAHDYFRRNDNLVDPTGPSKGKLSREQLKLMTYPSGLQFLTKSRSQGFRVVKQLPPSKRAFKAPSESASFRLVVNPGATGH
jgi:hypothetical protein